MKWNRTIILFDRGFVAQTDEWQAFHESYVQAIRSIDFPQGSGELILRQKIRNSAGKWDRNGVGYLKTRFLSAMRADQRWRIEDQFTIDTNLLTPTLQGTSRNR